MTVTTRNQITLQRPNTLVEVDHAVRIITQLILSLFHLLLVLNRVGISNLLGIRGEGLFRSLVVHPFIHRRGISLLTAHAAQTSLRESETNEKDDMVCGRNKQNGKGLAANDISPIPQMSPTQGAQVMIVDAEQNASRGRYDAEQDRKADSDKNHVVVEQILQNEVAHHQNE